MSNNDKSSAHARRQSAVVLRLSPPKREEKKRKPSDFVLSNLDKANMKPTQAGKVYQIMINLRQNDTDVSNLDKTGSAQTF